VILNTKGLCDLDHVSNEGQFKRLGMFRKNRGGWKEEDWIDSSRRCPAVVISAQDIAGNKKLLG